QVQCDLWFPHEDLPLGDDQHASPPVLVMTSICSGFIQARVGRGRPQRLEGAEAPEAAGGAGGGVAPRRSRRRRRGARRSRWGRGAGGATGPCPGCGAAAGAGAPRAWRSPGRIRWRTRTTESCERPSVFPTLGRVPVRAPGTAEGRIREGPAFCGPSVTPREAARLPRQCRRHSHRYGTPQGSRRGCRPRHPR
ncbi:hypothetical protein B7R24_14630, partial [Subtercola boreus]